MTKTLIVTPATSPGRFNAALQNENALVVKSTRQPLVDGARALLARGHGRSELLTMRHQGSAHDSFLPRTIEFWAGKTYEENKKRLKMRKFRPL